MSVECSPSSSCSESSASSSQRHLIQGVGDPNRWGCVGNSQSVAHRGRPTPRRLAAAVRPPPPAPAPAPVRVPAPAPTPTPAALRYCPLYIGDLSSSITDASVFALLSSGWKRFVHQFISSGAVGREESR